MIKKDKFLVELRFKSGIYSVRATAHARERMIMRDVEEFVVIGNILAFGEDRLKWLHEFQDEVVVTDEVNNVAIVVCFKANTLHIITVLDDKNIWNNRGTKMVRITEEGIIG